VDAGPGRALVVGVDDLNQRGQAALGGPVGDDRAPAGPLGGERGGGLGRRQGADQQAGGVLGGGPVERDVAGVVARGALLLQQVAGLVVDDDQAEARQRGEHGGAAADGDAGAAGAQLQPVPVAAPVGRPGQVGGVGEPLADGVGDGRPGGDLGRDHDGAAPAGQDQLDEVGDDLAPVGAGLGPPPPDPGAAPSGGEVGQGGGHPLGRRGGDARRHRGGRRGGERGDGGGLLDGGDPWRDREPEGVGERPGPAGGDPAGQLQLARPERGHG
jgi:hypothetical protein